LIFAATHSIIGVNILFYTNQTGFKPVWFIKLLKNLNASFFECTILARFGHRILYSIYKLLRKKQKDKKTEK
jgi:hypothetical protein